MLRALVALALGALLAAPADAQRRRDRDHAWFARKGDFALTFSIDALTVRPAEGGVGGRLWLSDRTAVGAALGFGFTTLEGPYGEDADALRTSFALGFEQHFGRSRRVSPFAGATVRVSHAEFDVEEFYYPTPPPEPYPCEPEVPCPKPGPYPLPYPYTRTVSESVLGVAGVLGAEVRVADGVTLMAAHRLGLTYVRGDADLPVFPDGPLCEGCEGGPRDGGFGYGEDYRRVEIGTGTTALTISIYF